MTDTPHRDAARKMPDALSSSVTALGSTTDGTSWTKAFGPDAFGGTSTLGPGMTALIDATSPKPGGGTSWMTALGIDTYNGPDMSALIDTLGPKPGDAISSWMTANGPDTYGGTSALSTLADTVLGMKNFDGLGLKAFGLAPGAPGADHGMTAFIDTLSPKPGDTSWMTAFGSDTGSPSAAMASLIDVGPGMNAFIDAVSPTTIDGLIGAPWIKSLGGGGTYSPLLDDALSPTSLVEEISPSLETVDVPEFSVSTLPVETSPPAPVYGGSDFYETVVNFHKWPWDAKDFVAIMVTVGFLPLVLLFHLQGLDWALAGVGAVATLFPALVLRDSK